MDQWTTLPFNALWSLAQKSSEQFCGRWLRVTQVNVLRPNVVTSNSEIPDASQFATYRELLEATAWWVHRAASGEPLTAGDLLQAEILQWRASQLDSFFLWFSMSNSKLLTLSPELDKEMDVIWVRGRLRRAEALDIATKHPIVLDPSHALTKLIIKDYNHQLNHPGPERVLAEIRRKFWILSGREAIRSHQFRCTECWKWRAKPEIPQMSDLPVARLHFTRREWIALGPSQ